MITSGLYRPLLDPCTVHARRHRPSETGVFIRGIDVGLPATKSVRRKEEAEAKSHGSSSALLPMLLMSERTLMSVSIALIPMGLTVIVEFEIWRPQFAVC